MKKSAKKPEPLLLLDEDEYDLLMMGRSVLVSRKKETFPSDIPVYAHPPLGAQARWQEIEAKLRELQQLLRPDWPTGEIK